MTWPRLKPLVVGAATFLPGMARLCYAGSRTGGGRSADYCYAIWMRHLLAAHGCAGLSCVPSVVAEFGPGASLGVGLAALLSGAERYYALDVRRFADTEADLAVFDGLVALFVNRAPLPSDPQGQILQPPPVGSIFTSGLLNEEWMQRCLAEDRVARLRDGLRNAATGRDAGPIRYFVPWTDESLSAPRLCDFIFSQAVMEHVDDVPAAYRCMASWLRPGGLTTHAIDYRSHGITPAWNGHWACPDALWALVKGRRPFLINRVSHSGHREGLQRAGFAIVHEESTGGGEVPHIRPAGRFRGLPPDDFRLRAGFFVARRPAEGGSA
jgi:hypothetical protein